MATKSGALAIGVGFTQIATALAGEEVVVFGLVFENSTAAERTVTLRLHKQETGTDVDIPFRIAAASPEGRRTWEKAIGLQPGDALSVSADAPGVALMWSVDRDDGVNPIQKGINPRGVWSALGTYAVNDLAEYGGSAWLSLVDGNTGNQPDASPAAWMLFAEVDQGMIDAAVAAGLSAVRGDVPPNLDTLEKLAASIGDDPNFAQGVTAALGQKANASIQISGAGLLAGQGGNLEGDIELELAAATPAQIRAGLAANVVVTPGEQDAALVPVVVADAATVAWDLNAAPNGVVTIAGSRLIGEPTNPKLGKFYTLRIESTGAFSPAFHSCFDFGQNGAGAFPSGAGKYAVLDVQCVGLAPSKFRSNLWKGA